MQKKYLKRISFLLGIYFDKEKFNIYSEKEPVALDGYIDYQLTGVQQALEDISKYFEKYVDELMNHLW